MGKEEGEKVPFKFAAPGGGGAKEQLLSSVVRWRLRGPLMGTIPPHYYRHVVKILVVWVFRVIIFDEKKTRRNNCGTCPTWKNRQKQTHW